MDYENSISSPQSKGASLGSRSNHSIRVYGAAQSSVRMNERSSAIARAWHRCLRRLRDRHRFHQLQLASTKRQIISYKTNQSPFLLPRLALRILSLPFPFADKKSSGISFQLLVDAVAPDTALEPPRLGRSSSLLVSYSCASPLALLLPIGCISLPMPSVLCPLTLGGAGLGRSTNPPGVHFQSLFVGGSKLGVC